MRREAERIYVGKRRNDHTLPQEEIGELLVRLAREGKRVLRLKGGDPFIFGRGGEEIEKLADHQIPFQVCPGITAAAACSAYSGIPLTHRDHAQACVFVTGHGKDGPIDLDWSALIRPNQTVAIYMGLAHLDELAQAFVAHGADPDLPAAVVDNGARANQRVVTGTLRTIAAQGARGGAARPDDHHRRHGRHVARKAEVVRRDCPLPLSGRIREGSPADPASRERPELSSFAPCPRPSATTREGVRGADFLYERQREERHGV